MIWLKASLLAFIGATISSADISWIVTDTGTTPIIGAVVRLEKSGQTATTGADGHFTLNISTSNTPSTRRSFSTNLSASIAGNMMNVMTSEHSIIEIAIFDLNGKVLSIIHQSVDMGIHSILLPQKGAGVYLYKVKSGNIELILKGNTLGGIAFKSSQITQNRSIITMAKQTKATAIIDDVITCTKAGWLNYHCVFGNSDTTGIVIKMIVNAGDITDVDGNVYQSVKIGNQTWMAENLRVTKYNDNTLIPLDTSSTTWYYAYTPKYCFYQNTTTIDSIKKLGALYNWYVVNPVNSKKIAPAGWRVPSDDDWYILENYLIANGYNWDGTITNHKIAKSIAAKIDWETNTYTGTIGCNLTKNNTSGFSAIPCAGRYSEGTFNTYRSDNAYWWSSSEESSEQAFVRSLDGGTDYFARMLGNKSAGMSIRLLKN